jgi:hypothetical protein
MVLCGELNDNLAYIESDGEYYYENIEFFFINKNSKKCYRSLDTSNISCANALMETKLAQFSTDKIDEKIFSRAHVSNKHTIISIGHL